MPVAKNVTKAKAAPPEQNKPDPDFGAPILRVDRKYKYDPVSYQLLLRATMAGNEEEVRQALKLGAEPRAYFEHKEDP